MDVFVFVICVIAITTVAGIYKDKLKAQSKMTQGRMNDETEARFAEMEDRIQTLERIVTDQKTQLKNKIDAL